MIPVHEGGCHCGRVRFRVTAPLQGLTECNCSICTKKGYLHLIVAPAQFQLLSGEADLSTYRFNTGVAQHHFCRICGVAPFYVPRSDPGKIDVNVRCLDSVDLTRLPVAKFDGRNWEAAMGTQVPWCREDPSFTLAAILTVRAAALDQFRAYERTAASIMRRYGGAIVRTVTVGAPADADLVKEVHVVTFPNAESFAAYRADPDLLAAAPLREASVVAIEVLVGHDGPDYHAGS